MRQVRHRRYISTEVQFPASLEAKDDDITGKHATLIDKTASARRFSAGAATVVKLLDLACCEEFTSAPMTLK